MKKWADILKEKHIENSHSFYGVYKLILDIVRNYVGEWFLLEEAVAPTGEYYNQSYMTIVHCDLETTRNLYNCAYNPLIISIVCPTGAKFKKDDKDRLLYYMIVSINSIDDASFTIWFKETPLTKLVHIRKQIMAYVKQKDDYINGTELLKFCAELGADWESRHYD